MRFFDFCLECVERHVPELIEPRTQGAEPLRVDVVHATGAGGLIDDQACGFQNFQMLGYRWPAHWHFGGDVAYGARAGTQMLEHLPTCGVG